LEWDNSKSGDAIKGVSNGAVDLYGRPPRPRRNTTLTSPVR
jgi:hypothetical protein